MKSRKVLQFNLLVGQVLTDVKIFKADVRMIRRRIEDLIQRGYMEKNPENNKELIYIP